MYPIWEVGEFYSPECVEGKFCELRRDDVLRRSGTSFVRWSTYLSSHRSMLPSLRLIADAA